MKTQYFDNFAATSSGRRAATLLATHVVKSEQIFSKVFADVTDAVAHLVVDCKYTTEMLCDPATWANWKIAEKRVAGMCSAYLVKNALVGLELHRTPSGKGKNRYCLPAAHDEAKNKPTFSPRTKGHGYTLTLMRKGM